MLVALAAVAFATAFHLMPFPADVSSVSPTFALQGYTSESDHSVTELPQFSAETDTLRATARISFLAPATGACLVMQTETVNQTAFKPIGQVDGVKGQREFVRAVFPSVDDLDESDDWVPLMKERLKVLVVCGDDQNEFFASQVYQVDVAQST